MKKEIYMVNNSDEKDMRFCLSFDSAKKCMGKMANEVAKQYKFSKKDYSEYPYEICVEVWDDDSYRHCGYIQLRKLSEETIECITFDKEYVKEYTGKLKNEKN